NVYVIPVTEPGHTPSTSGDIIQLATNYMILVEDQSPQIVQTDDNCRLIMGDIIAILMLNRPLTYNGLATVRDTYINNMDAEYLPPNENNDIRRWVMLSITCEKKLNQNTVTS